ncbi:hypothetical protein PV328_001049 [Microctonus aethiopoides]|uniref:Uncharacterized protein n=1 Tax=Microctonus aethiopoides TaxID=144406 RepID=A0AA39KX80_9HYME|nr:hypothetical protein PV328_001049 [Microctonus aethiopoides]
MLKELKSSSQGSTNNFESNSAPSNSLSNVVNSKNIKPLCIVTKNNVNKENVGDGGCVGAVDGTSRAHIDKINLFNVNDNKIRPINVGKNKVSSGFKQSAPNKISTSCKNSNKSIITKKNGNKNG